MLHLLYFFTLKFRMSYKQDVARGVSNTKGLTHISW